jgi:hypothetical protein
MILLRTGLVLHITGITLMVGGAIASFILQKQLWRLLPADKERAGLLVRAGSRLKMMQEAGVVLVFSGGILMMVALHGLVMSTFWFRVKLILLGLIILNELITARPAMKKLRRWMAVDVPLSVDGIRLRLRVFFLLQFLFFLLIFILSVFQPA